MQLKRHAHGAQISARLAVIASCPLCPVLAHAGLSALFATARLQAPVLAVLLRRPAVLALASLPAVHADGCAATFFTVTLPSVVLA